ncbi:MAG: BON domain-containing protein [Xenococcus sp. MO_188.B8]|nr:BON domain-containing protein [Xenococcus sp. MO_188.B8]
MKLFTDLVLTALLFGSVNVIRFNSIEEVAKTSSDAPDSIEVLVDYTIQKNRQDAVSNLRKAQLNADIRAREQRYLLFGEGKPRDDHDLQSEVRSKLELNLPTASLAVQAKSSLVTVVGTVQEPQHLQKIATLAQEIPGVIQVKVKAIAVNQ